MSYTRVMVGTIFLVGFLHVPAVMNYWYFSFWWYDVMMHFLGGCAMGWLALFSWGFLAPKMPQSWKTIVLRGMYVVGFGALMGVGWEWFEGLTDALVLPRLDMGSAQLGLVDTMLDLFFDIFGGFCVYLVALVWESSRKV